MRRANDLSKTRANFLVRHGLVRLPRAAQLGAGAVVATFGLGGAGVALADPAASFSISDERPARGQIVTLTATADCLAPLSCTWSGDDGLTGSGREVEHAYSTLGTKQVTLTVNEAVDGSGDPEVVTHTIDVVNRPPVAAIDVSPVSIVVDQPVTFASASTDPDGDGLRLAWDIDGERALGGETTPAITHSFGTPGSHSVRLHVIDDHGETDTATVTVEVANLAPTVSIAASPPTVLTGESISFSASGEDPDGGSLDFAWDLDADGFDDGSTASIGPLVFEVPGTRRVRVSATDGEGGRVVEELSVVIGNRGPSADFDWTPATVERRRPVTFTSRATDPEGLDLVEQSWDLDGDGAYDDAFGPTATTTFHKGGTHEVGLRVVDAHGGIAEVRIPIVLANRPPTASFTVSPEQPVVGDTVELTSTSVGSDGEELQPAWDLDGDGEFDDATGPGARVVVARAGRVSMGLRVVDDGGGVDISRRDVEVLTRGPEPAPVAQKPEPRMLSPFPSVRIAGSLTRRGARFRVVSVSAPKGARVSWACAARRCRGGRRVVTGRALRIRALQRDFPGGATFEVRVTRRGWIGKYTRVKVLRDRGPARRDLCLAAGSRRPTACPG